MVDNSKSLYTDRMVRYGSTMFAVCLAIIISVLADDSVLTTAFVFTPPSSGIAFQRHNVALDASKIYDECDIAIMGGGFGGLYTALAISREAKRMGRSVDAVLVDPSDRFVFLPLLYDLTMGTASEDEVCPTYKNLLEGTGIRHIKGSFAGFSSTTSGDYGDSGSSLPVLSEAVLTTISEPKYNSEKKEKGIKKDVINLSFRASVVAVGASPQSILASVPGATEYTQPFYTKKDAYATRELLFRMDQKIRQGEKPRLAVVGGGYGGVELSACIKRRFGSKADVVLLSREAPMAGTRAEPLVDQALSKLGVICEMCSVNEIKKQNNKRITIESFEIDTEDEWDAVFWTAGSGPALTNDLGGLALTSSGRLMVDNTLQCCFSMSNPTKRIPSVWALGDCSEIVSMLQPVPATAQAAIQQADIVAANVLAKLFNQGKKTKTFEFQDIGSMLSLGGPNAAIIGPREESQLGSILIPLLDTAREGLGVADNVFAQIVNSPSIDKSGVIAPTVENLSLSLGGYGLGVDPEATPGTLSGTLSGASRRAIYALRMPTNRQQRYGLVSAFISSASALVKEASDQIQSSSEK